MPLHYSSATIIGNEVWAHLPFRRLTNLADARAAYIDLLADAKVGLAALEAIVAAIPTTPELEADASKRYVVLTAEQLETEWGTDAVVDNVASMALTNLSTHTIAALTYPTGAVEVRVILLGLISGAAQAAATHHVGVKVQRNINAGGWADLKDFTLNPPLALSADGTMGALPVVVDITALVASGDNVQLRFAVDSDNAGSVNYMTSFTVVLIYRMS